MTDYTNFKEPPMNELFWQVFHETALQVDPTLQYAKEMLQAIDGICFCYIPYGPDAGQVRQVNVEGYSSLIGCYVVSSITGGDPFLMHPRFLTSTTQWPLLSSIENPNFLYKIGQEVYREDGHMVEGFDYKTLQVVHQFEYHNTKYYVVVSPDDIVYDSKEDWDLSHEIVKENELYSI